MRNKLPPIQGISYVLQESEAGRLTTPVFSVAGPIDYRNAHGLTVAAIVLQRNGPKLSMDRFISAPVGVKLKVSTMKLSYTILAALPLLAGALLMQSPSATVKAHADKLVSSKTLTLRYSVQVVGGTSFEKTVSLAKPNRLRIESPSQLIVSDGKTQWTLNKKTNEYIESPAPSNTEKLLEDEGIWYAAFFNQKFMDGIGTSKAGKIRKMKGISIREVEITFPKNSGASATLLIDDSIGVARGMIWKETAPKPFEMVVFADEIALDKSVEDSLFVFAPPQGAKKLDPNTASASDTPTWQQVSAIFMGNCAGCHGARTARGGLNLTTYESVMAGSRSGKVIVPGDVNGSRIIQYLYGRGRPQMPPGGKMPDSVISKIEKWIAAGAEKS